MSTPKPWRADVAPPRSNRRTRMHLFAVALLVSTACASPLFGHASLAQTAPANAQVSRDAADFSVAGDVTMTIRADKTVEEVKTRRIKVLGVAAAQQVGQQSIGYVDGMQSLEIVEAFTEKADGTKIPVDLATVITRDAATGLGAVYLRDHKVVTVIFPNVSVGDTIVLTTRALNSSGVFAGHFVGDYIFPRIVPFADWTVRVIAPSSLPLDVAVRGEGVEHETVVDGNETRHLITYRTRPTIVPEAGSTSLLDRDPRVSISTFKDYEEQARSYWDAARGAIQVTPEIAKLADELTRGIDDKRAQANAISNWVKANIRYVAIYLGAGRVVPNSAAVVLKNRYGDCKDHVVLLSTLLAAKGIAAEHVLISAGDAYTLPEPATMAYINHVIIYLPELGIYDDPTVGFAPFGVLGAGDYDKPVIHISDRAAYRAHTPAMKPEDHVSTRRTRVAVAADGTVSGATEQVGTGLFAIKARVTAASIQSRGLERSAEQVLRSNGSPGKGRFQIGSLAELGESYAVRGEFVLDARLNIKPSSRHAVPAGLAILGRPGDQLLGTRNPARTLPFVCLAGKQIEEIEVTFAEGLPLPAKITGRRIETESFVYTSDYRLEDRTWKVRREFMSRVPGQACAAEVEAEITRPMKDVAGSLSTQMVFPAAPSTSPVQITRVAVADQPLQVAFLYSLNPDCSPIGVATVRVIEEPTHGKMTVEKGTGFTSFPQNNPRSTCNTRRSEGLVISYQPESGYTGTDSILMDVIYPDGTASKRRYSIKVM